MFDHFLMHFLFEFFQSLKRTYQRRSQKQAKMQKSPSIPTMINWHTFAIQYFQLKLTKSLRIFGEVIRSPWIILVAGGLLADLVAQPWGKMMRVERQRLTCDGSKDLGAQAEHVWSIQVVGSAFSRPNRALCHCFVWINLKIKKNQLWWSFFKRCS